MLFQIINPCGAAWKNSAAALQRVFSLVGALLCFSVCSTAWAGTVTAYANTGYTTGSGGVRESLDGVVLSPYFNVTAGSTPLYVYNAQVRSVNFQDFTSSLTGQFFTASQANGDNGTFTTNLGTASFASFQLSGTTTVVVSFQPGYPTAGTITNASQIKILGRVTNNIGPITVYSAGNSQCYPAGSFSFDVTEQEDANGNGIPQQLTIEINGDWLNSLHLFINPPPTTANNPPTGSNVFTMTPGTASQPRTLTQASFTGAYTAYVFPHGVYNVTSALNWGSGIELYLEDGAFLNFTGSNTEKMPMIGMGGWPLNDIPAIVRGWGVLDGQAMQSHMLNDSNAETCPVSSQVQAPMCQSQTGVALADCGGNTSILSFADMSTSANQQVLIDGVVLRNSCTWNLPLWNNQGSASSPIIINNIKILGFSGATKNESNSDGIDLIEDQYVNITNSFFRTADDLITIKQESTSYPSSNHINVVGNTFWNEVAHAMVIGTELENGSDGFAAQNILFDSNTVVRDTGKSPLMAFFDQYGGQVQNITWSNNTIEQATALWQIDLNPSSSGSCSSSSSWQNCPGAMVQNMLICRINQTVDQTAPQVIPGYGGLTNNPYVGPVPNLQMEVALPYGSAYVGGSTYPQGVQAAPVFSDVVVNGVPVTSSVAGNDYYYLAADGLQATNSTVIPQNEVEMTVKLKAASSNPAPPASIWSYQQAQIASDMVAPQFTTVACPVSSLLQTASQMVPTVSVWPTASAITYGQTLASSTLSGGAASVPGTFSFATPATVPSAGTSTQSVIFTPEDTVDYTSVVGSVALAVSQVVPVVIWSAPSPIAYGTTLSVAQLSAIAKDANGNALAGSFSYTVGATALYIGDVLNAGTYNVTATFTPSSTNYASGVSASASLTVTKAATSTLVSTSGNPVIVNTSVTMTAIVQAATNNGIPTGAVSFFDGSTLLGSGALNSSGVATYASNALVLGAHTITATYAGDGNFSGSNTGSGVTLLVTTAADFTLTAIGSTSQTVGAGSSVNYQYQITPVANSFMDQVTFAASGLPAGAKISFVPATINAGASQETVTATIQTSATSTNNVFPSTINPGTYLLGLLLVPMFTLRPRLQKKLLRSGFVWMVSLAIAAAAFLLTGCSNASQSAANVTKNYTVTITASSGGIQHSFDVGLELQ